MTEILLIEEIIRKECERYELEENGFVSNRRTIVAELTSTEHPYPATDCSIEEYSEWKAKLLSSWYMRKDFAMFFHQKAKKKCMIRLVKQLLLNILCRLHKKHTEETIDDELNIGEGRTIAFKLSSEYFLSLYNEICSGKRLFLSPRELEETCEARLHSLYPLKYPHLYERLLKRDGEFWKEILILVRRFIHLLVVKWRGKEDKEAIKDISMETILSVQEQLNQGKLSRIESAGHLLNSLHSTGRNKLREWLRMIEKNNIEVLLEEKDWLCLEEEKSMAVNYPNNIDNRFAYLLEVNEKSEYEVCCALADVLNFNCGKVYEELVKGMEDAARAIQMLYVENKRYEDIATSIYGTFDERKLAKLRKSVSRSKEYLKKRMVNLIIIYKQEGKVPLVAEEEE